MAHGLLNRMLRATTERGGSFGRDTDAALLRAERDGAAPGTEGRSYVAVESSPLRRRRRKATPARRLAYAGAIAAMLVALWHTGEAVYIHAKALLGQRLVASAWSKAREHGSPVKPWPWADTYPVARLVVPAHDVELLVLEGASGRTLAWGPAHVEGTALPGARGNAIVTAHRDTHFAFLKDLEPGQRIVVERADGLQRTYHVERAVIADHRELRLPADERTTTLVLITCYPFDAIDAGTTMRYAVIARGIDG